MEGTLIGVLLLATVIYGQETCLTGTEDPYVLFGTKTAYIFSNRGATYDKAMNVPGCEPAAVWLMNRHGSHNPEANEIVELQKLTDLRDIILRNYQNGNYRNTNQRICQADLNLLQQWQWKDNQNVTFAGQITSAGYMATQLLAQGWKQRYPTILTDNLHNYMFKFVNDQRSNTTFKAFTDGLFRGLAEEYNIPRENDEQKLRPYKFCKTWTSEVEQNNETLAQLHIFESKMEYRNMISNISRRLGFNYEISKDTVKDMYDMCRYNKAWDEAKISPWCAAFTTEDLKRLEYAEDLEMYLKYGYGVPINEKVGCTLVKDMIDFFAIHTTKETPQQPRVMIHLTEFPSFLLTLTALGAHRDIPLTGDNYNTNQMRGRKWTTSSMVPYNANLAAVLHKCTQNGNFQVKEEYQVLFLENERPLYFEDCHVGLCPWSVVKKKFVDAANKCDMEFCNAASSVNSIMALTVSVIAFLFRHVL